MALILRTRQAQRIRDAADEAAAAFEQLVEDRDRYRGCLVELKKIAKKEGYPKMEQFIREALNG